ncbi:MAG: hypothetical protein PHP03_02125 [Candidatus Pacebacteria bacterium]|nr:hypothetical protein [Candidatus Paceibacterota bacterium]
MNYKNIFKKLIVSFVLAAMIFSSVGLLAPKKAQAVWGVGDITFDPANLWQMLKEYGEKVAGPLFKHLILDKLVDRTIEMINNDQLFDGHTPFVENWNDFLSEAADQALGEIAIDLGAGFLCSPFSAQLQIVIKEPPTFSHQVKCTLTQITDNINNFIDDFQNGNWLTYREMWSPNNNFYGSTILALDESAKKTAEKQTASQNEAQSGGGFLSTKKCVKYDKKKDASGKYLEPVQDDTTKCLEYKLMTPGTVVSRALIGATVDTPSNSIINASDTSTYIAAILDAAINRMSKALISGLASIGKTTQSSDDCASLKDDQEAYDMCKSLVKTKQDILNTGNEMIASVVDESLNPRIQAQQILEGITDTSGYHPGIYITKQQDIVNGLKALINSSCDSKIENKTPSELLPSEQAFLDELASLNSANNQIIADSIDPNKFLTTLAEDDPQEFLDSIVAIENAKEERQNTLISSITGANAICNASGICAGLSDYSLLVDCQGIQSATSTVFLAAKDSLKDRLDGSYTKIKDGLEYLNGDKIKAIDAQTTLVNKLYRFVNTLGYSGIRLPDKATIDLNQDRYTFTNYDLPYRVTINKTEENQGNFSFSQDSDGNDSYVSVKVSEFYNPENAILLEANKIYSDNKTKRDRLQPVYNAVFNDLHSPADAPNVMTLIKGVLDILDTTTAQNFRWQAEAAGNGIYHGAKAYTTWFSRHSESWFNASLDIPAPTDCYYEDYDTACGTWAGPSASCGDDMFVSSWHCGGDLCFGCTQRKCRRTVCTSNNSNDENNYVNPPNTDTGVIPAPTNLSGARKSSESISLTWQLPTDSSRITYMNLYRKIYKYNSSTRTKGEQYGGETKTVLYKGTGWTDSDTPATRTIDAQGTSVVYEYQIASSDGTNESSRSNILDVNPF